MLKNLYIKNFTLIDQLDIDFHPGFSVITGETGAGKSIILGAIGLLLGNRADSKLVKRTQGDDGRTVKCTIEAHFDLSRYDFAPFFEENDLDFDPDDTIIRRELTSTGKSRSFINDMPVSQQLMRQLGEQLIDIHSQHQNLLLQKDDFQLNVVDIIADNGLDRAAFSEAFTRYREAEQRLRSLEKQIEASEQNRDFLQFQYNELSAAQLVEGEQEQLEQEGETLNHAGDIKTAIYTADNLLSGDDRGAVVQVRMAAQQLQSIASVYPKTQELANRLDSVHIELDDIAHEVAADMESIDFDPSRQDAIIARLDQIYSLQQKYRVNTVAELLQLQASIQQQLESIENADGDLALLRQEVAEQEKLCREKAQQLTLSRTASARKVEAEMHARLVPLGIPNVRFEVEVKLSPALCQWRRPCRLPLLRQPWHAIAARFPSGFGWRDRARDALAQGNDQRHNQVAHHHLRRDRHRRFGQDSREDGHDHGRDGGRRTPGDLHHPPATDCLTRSPPLQSGEDRHARRHGEPHEATLGRRAGRGDRHDALGRERHRGCAGERQGSFVHTLIASTH